MKVTPTYEGKEEKQKSYENGIVNKFFFMAMERKCHEVTS